MVFWALSPSDRTWSVHSRIRECGPFHAGISWLHKLGTGRERWSVPLHGQSLRNTNNGGFLRGRCPRNLRPALQCLLAKYSPRRRGAGCKSMVVHILGCRRCLIHLQVIEGIWICGFPPEISLKGADFQKCFAHFPPNWGSFLLSPLNRGLLGKGRC